MKKIVNMIGREPPVLVWTLALYSVFITVPYLDQKMPRYIRSEIQKKKRWFFSCKSNGLSGQIPIVFVRMLSRLLVTH